MKKFPLDKAQTGGVRWSYNPNSTTPETRWMLTDGEGETIFGMTLLECLIKYDGRLFNALAQG